MRHFDGRGVMATTVLYKGGSLPDRLWTHAETADWLNITESSLHQLNHAKKGPRSYRVGRYRRYDPRDVQAWLNGRASDSAA